MLTPALSPWVEYRQHAMHVGQVVAEVPVSHPGAAIKPLQTPEYLLDRGPAPCDQSVAALLPARQARLVLMPAMYDPVLDALPLQSRPARLLS